MLGAGFGLERFQGERVFIDLIESIRSIKTLWSDADPAPAPANFEASAAGLGLRPARGAIRRMVARGGISVGQITVPGGNFQPRL